MGKGGGSAHTPVEAKETSRSKQLVKIVEILSEGEVAGLANGMKSVYLDNTPVQNSNNSYNFKNFSLQGRVGSQAQGVLGGFNTSEKEVSVGAQVKNNLPITRTITDSKVSRLRFTIGVQSLSNMEENGDIKETEVNLAITIGSTVYPVTIFGKYSSQYLQQHTFKNLPPVPFTIKVERLTADSNSQRLQNNTVWSSYTEVIDTEFTYPNTALIGVKFDSEYFGNIPNRTYDLLGIKVKIPSNYNPRTRQYSGVWDGTFKVDWTDNPAWVLFDIVTNKRYGLGNRLGEFGADKWTLYQVAQYCDQLVPDGFGGREPRFTCNAWLTEQRSAYDVINDICSIFRAMPVWNGQQLTVVMDRPADPVWTYTNANVENGEFNYTFSAKKARHNAIQVEYADKDNGYEKAIEYVSDDESIRRNGLNVKKITAFGCTSRGQAHRTGLWLLQTEKLETKTVTFTVGAEGLMHVPGDIIKVADTYYAGTNIGGRVLAINSKKVTLDREISINGNSYFSYINAQAKHQDIKIISVNGAEVTLDQAPAGLEAYSVWSLSTQQVTSQLFKALSVKEDGKGKYTITALQHEPQKEAIVDNGAKFEPKSTSILSAPQISNIGVITNPDGSVSFATDITGGNGLVKYDIKIYKDGALYDVRLGQSSPNISFDDLENGEYTVVIQIKNEKGQLLGERTQTFTIDKPPAPTGVIVTGGLGNITIEWDWIDEATSTEIFVSETNDIKTAKRLAKVNSRTYTHEVGAKQVRYYWLRHTRGVNIGPFNQRTGIRGESSVDIDAELEVLNKKLSQNIVDEVIDTALPARNLELIKTASELNTSNFIGHNQVYNTKDGKLYIWNGREYTAKVQASDLSGKVSKSQLDNALIGEITETGRAINEIKSTKANKNEVASIAQSSLQAIWKNDAKAEFDKLSIGGRNLIRNSGTPITSSDYGQRYVITEAPAVGDDVVVTLYGEVGTDRTGIGIFNSRGYGELFSLEKIADGVYQGKGKWKLPNGGTNDGIYADNTHLNLYFYPSSANSNYTINKVKFERGTVATDWTPAPEDAESSIAELTNYQKATAEKDKAQAQQITALTSSVASAKAEVQTISQTVADVSGKLSATHTIKTQVISGGKTAIAGISLGANKEESSVIVMADKFQVVPNASGTPKPIFKVQNGKVVVAGDLIADGEVTASKLATNSVTTGALQAGAVRAEHIAATQITGEKLALGLGGNLLKNPLFTGNSDGWHGFVWHNEEIRKYWTAGSVGVEYENLRYNTNQAYRPRDSQYKNETFGFARWTVNGFSQLAVDSKNNQLWVDNARVFANVIAGKTYIFSAYVGCHHCGGYLIAEEYSADSKNYVRRLADSGLFGERSNILLNDGEACIEASSSHFANGLNTSGAHRAFVKFTAPSSGVVCLIFRIARFGNKQAYQDCYMARAMLEEVNPSQTTPSPWRETSITSIDGGSIVTNSITTKQLGADSVTANNIAAGAVAAKHIAANSINSNHIVTRSLTSDKLNIGSLSAISSNIGRITAGEITGTNIHGNTISGGEIRGSNINGGTIRGVTIEGSTIRGVNIEGQTIKADNIIGDIAKFYSVSAYRADNRYDLDNTHLTIDLPAAPFWRKALLYPATLPFGIYAANTERDDYRFEGVNMRLYLNDKRHWFSYNDVTPEKQNGQKFVMITTMIDLEPNRAHRIRIRLRASDRYININGTTFTFMVARS
nr:MAG TPA: tail protein [Caudoviricetes sp.]